MQKELSLAQLWFWYNYHSAISGRFVKESYAKQHPNTTVKLRVKKDEVKEKEPSKKVMLRISKPNG